MKKKQLNWLDTDSELVRKEECLISCYLDLFYVQKRRAEGSLNLSQKHVKYLFFS